MTLLQNIATLFSECPRSKRIRSVISDGEIFRIVVCTKRLDNIDFATTAVLKNQENRDKEIPVRSVDSFSEFHSTVLVVFQEGTSWRSWLINIECIWKEVNMCSTSESLVRLNIHKSLSSEHQLNLLVRKVIIILIIIVSLRPVLSSNKKHPCNQVILQKWSEMEEMRVPCK